jgi:hypothetical protein
LNAVIARIPPPEPAPNNACQRFSPGFGLVEVHGLTTLGVRALARGPSGACGGAILYIAAARLPWTWLVVSPEGMAALRSTPGPCAETNRRTLSHVCGGHLPSTRPPQSQVWHPPSRLRGVWCHRYSRSAWRSALKRANAAWSSSRPSHVLSVVPRNVWASIWGPCVTTNHGS